MAAKKHAARIALQQASAALAAEVSSGEWRHLSGLNSNLPEQLTEVLAELECLRER